MKKTLDPFKPTSTRGLHKGLECCSLAQHVFLLLRGDFNDFCLAFLHIFYPHRWTNDSTWLYNIYMNFQLGCFNQQNIWHILTLKNINNSTWLGRFCEHVLTIFVRSPRKPPLFCIPIATGKITTRSCVRVNSCIVGQQRVGPPAELSWKASKLGEFLFTPKLCGSAIWRIMAKNVFLACQILRCHKMNGSGYFSWILDSWIVFFHLLVSFIVQNDYIWLLFNVQLRRNSSIMFDHKIIRENGGEPFVSLHMCLRRQQTCAYIF